MGRFEVALIGSGEVAGEEVLSVLSKSDLPVGRLRSLATYEMVSGEGVTFRGKDVKENILEESAFDGVRLAIFVGAAAQARKWARVAAGMGCWVIDATGSASREAPVIVPEINADALPDKPSLLANPSPASVALAIALAPLASAATIRRVVVSTYHGVSGLGRRGMDELSTQTRAMLAGNQDEGDLFPHRIAFNVIPQTDAFETDDEAARWTGEEQRLAEETPRLLGQSDLRVTATAARVPVFVGVALSVNVELASALSFEKARELLAAAPALRLVDEPTFHLYPLLGEVAGRDDVYVGRMRIDPTVPHGLSFWIAADDLRRGIALNVVGIAERLAERGLL